MRTSEWKKNNTRYLYVILHCHFLNHTKKPKNDFQYKRNNFFLFCNANEGGQKRRIPYFRLHRSLQTHVRVWMSGEGFTHRKIIYERWAGSGTLNKIFVFLSSYATGVEINENSKVIIGCTGSTSTKRNNFLLLLDVVK